MGNVIIGIMATILFIGLALAGANYLGSTLTATRASSDASQVVAGLQQISAGVRMYAQKSKGYPLAPSSGSINTLITGGYLKSVPANPVTPANSPYVSDSNGSFSSNRATFVLLQVGPAGNQLSMQTCIEIERSLGNKDRLDPATMSTPIAFGTRTAQVPQGCFELSGTPGTFLAYYTI